MRWREVIKLIAEVSGGTDELGYPFQTKLSERTIYGDVRTVGRTEFYQAYQAGLDAAMIVIVRTVDYQGERMAEVDGVRYTILRAYQRDSEFTELTLSDAKKISRQ